jgi:hypothetical protein
VRCTRLQGVKTSLAAAPGWATTSHSKTALTESKPFYVSRSRNDYNINCDLNNGIFGVFSAKQQDLQTYFDLTTVDFKPIFLH